MLLLSYGYKKPQAGDRATGTNGWFTQIEDNFQRLNDHTHNGTDSAKLPPASLAKYSSTISAGDWIDDGGGTWHYTVTTPAGMAAEDVSNYFLKFMQLDLTNVMHLSWERLTATTFTVWTNNLADIVILYV